MNFDPLGIPRSRVRFLLLLAVAITVLLFWVIADLVLATLLGAILAGLLQPLYRTFLRLTGNRQAVAAGLTVLVSLVLGIVPLLLLLGLVLGEAVHINESARDWLRAQRENSGTLHERLAEYPRLKLLLPYQDQIMEKASEMASKASGWVADGLASGVKGTASFLLSLFVMLYATFSFLINGRAMLDAALRHTPLTEPDRERLLGTFLSVSRATVKGKLIIGIVQGSLAGLSFWFAGIQGAIFWSTVMAVLSAIPSVGTAIVWIPAVAYLALTGQVGAAIGVGLWCALVVGTIDNLLTPRLIGKDTEMPDLLVLLTTLGGLTAFGIPGILIGPIIGALFLAAWQLWGNAFDEDRAQPDPLGPPGKIATGDCSAKTLLP